MKLAGMYVTLLCHWCFIGKHGQCDQRVRYQGAEGPAAWHPCECSVVR